MALLLAVAGCAAALVCIDVAKPLVIDDAAYHAFARQIAAHPGDPYGFEIFWYEAPQPAVEVLAPPVALYWWALGMRLLGDAPWLWKLWQLPLALLLCGSLAALLRRVAPSVAVPLLVAIVAAPTILPMWNLMVDLPALAISMAGLAMMLRATDRDRLLPALAAGCVLGIALQTKYTSLLPLLVALGDALLRRRPAHALVAGGAASAVFLSFEVFTWLAYGQSHFAAGVRHVRASAGLPAGGWLAALLGLLGSGALAMGPLALVALGAGRRRVIAAVTVASAGIAAVALLPGGAMAGDPSGFGVWPVEMWIFAPLGACVLALLSALALREASRVRGEQDAREADASRFVLLWLAVELVGFFVVSPFPALRRLIGLQVAAGFLVARALQRSGARAGLRPAIGFGVALGLLFAVSDVTDARTRVDALERAVARLDAEPSLAEDATRWYVGHWGFQFHAERHGLRPVVPGVSRLAEGDALVWPLGVYQQPLRVPGASLLAIDGISGSNPWPWSTLPWAYTSHPPLRRQSDFQIAIRLARITEPVTAR